MFLKVSCDDGTATDEAILAHADTAADLIPDDELD